MIDTSFLDQLSKFSLVVHKRVTSKYRGPRRSMAFGRGTLFKDHRLYAPGDDFRAIDWKVYARTDDLMVKTYEEDRNLVVHIIVDYSASMNFGKPKSKFDYASMLGVGFAYLALKENEKFMFSTFSESLNVFQPRRGMGQLIGDWEADTLVIHTTTFRDEQSYTPILSTETFEVEERLSLNSEGNILYKYTVTDPQLYTQPFTAEIPFTRMEQGRVQKPHRR